jgi:sensor histidine kinase YesM
LGIGLVDACQTVFPMHAQGMHHAWVALFVTLVATWLPWALATPFVMELTRRFPVLGGPSSRGLMVHIGTLAVLSVISAGWYALFEYILNPWAVPNPTASYWTLLLGKLSYDTLRSFVAYTLIVVIAEFLLSRERLAKAQTEAAELRAKLSEAKLDSLRKQMDPHFIFNALNSVCGLVRDNQAETAAQMLVALSSYMRDSATHSSHPVVTLAEEIDLLRQYLEIQRYRFGDRLQVHIDVPIEFLAANVPNLLLQPLAENAIKHGIAARAEGGTIEVSGLRVEDKLQLVVRNTAPHADVAESSRGLGLGLSNLRARLQLLYREDQSLEMERTADGEVEVRIMLPLERDGMDAAA